MDPLTNPAFLLFAFFSPLLISLLKQAGLSPQVNALIAQVAYIVIGVAAVVVSGTPITSAAYNLVWSNLGVATAGQASLEERLVVATSLKK
jgi:hypothetical protein